MQTIDATYQINNRSLRMRFLAKGQIEVRLDGGEWAETFDLDADRTPEDFQLAMLVATKVYGTRRGKVNATNSMVHEIWNAMHAIAGL